jgi:hypothetical protein
MKSTFVKLPDGSKYRVKYYQERAKPHDFVAVFPDEKYSGQRELLVSALTTCIAGHRDSVCFTGVSLEWLRNKCHRVEREKVWPSLIERAEDTE